MERGLREKRRWEEEKVKERMKLRRVDTRWKSRMEGGRRKEGVRR